MFRIAEAVLRVFHRLGDRAHRQKNRMKFLVKALGWVRSKSEIETELAAIEPIALPFDSRVPSDFRRRRRRAPGARSERSGGRRKAAR